MEIHIKNKNIKPRVITGNEACAEGALAAGLKFYAGYPITPSSEIAEILSYELPRVGGKFIQMEDEIGSIAAIIGASLAGAKSMTATSGPGFSLMQENIGYAVMAEVPCVIVNVMRGGPSTGLPTLPSQGDVMQARWGTHGDHPIIALAPNGVAETFELTVRAFELSEKYRTPVILLMDEIIGHVNEKVLLPGPDELSIFERHVPEDPVDDFLPYRITESGVPPMATFGGKYRFHVTGLSHDETGFPTNNSVEINRLMKRLNSKLDNNRDDIIDVEIMNDDHADIGILAYGSTSRSARRAVHLAQEKGIRISMLRPKVLWPFPDQEIRQFAKGIKSLIIPEMNLGQYAHEVAGAIDCAAKIYRINRIDGEAIPPLDIVNKIEEIS